MNSYERIKSEVFRENLEDDDCGVIAAMAVTGLSYEETRELLAPIFRATASGRGLYRSDLNALLRTHGWIVQEVEVPYNLTVAMVPDRFTDGHYLIGCPGHLMACVNGELFNSRSKWGAPVDGIAHVSGGEQATRSKRV